jgi:hypothetical protein
LLGDTFEYGFLLEVRDGLMLPLLGPAHHRQIREEQLELQVKLSVQVIRVHVDLRSEQANIIDFHFFFAISYEEGA